MEGALVHLVQTYLASHLHGNALFYAERLVEVAPTEMNRHLLALCHVHCGAPGEALEALGDASAAGNRYLRGKLLLEAGRTREAVDCLCPPPIRAALPLRMTAAALSDIIPRLPGGAAGAYLLALAAKENGEATHAVAWASAALAADPFLFCAFEALCRWGAHMDAAAAFSPTLLPAVLPAAAPHPGGEALKPGNKRPLAAMTADHRAVAAGGMHMEASAIEGSHMGAEALGVTGMGGDASAVVFPQPSTPHSLTPAARLQVTSPALAAALSFSSDASTSGVLEAVAHAASASRDVVMGGGGGGEVSGVADMSAITAAGTPAALQHTTLGTASPGRAYRASASVAATPAQSLQYVHPALARLRRHIPTVHSTPDASASGSTSWLPRSLLLLSGASAAAPAAAAAPPPAAMPKIPAAPPSGHRRGASVDTADSSDAEAVQDMITALSLSSAFTPIDTAGTGSVPAPSHGLFASGELPDPARRLFTPAPSSGAVFSAAAPLPGAASGDVHAGHRGTTADVVTPVQRMSFSGLSSATGPAHTPGAAVHRTAPPHQPSALMSPGAAWGTSTIAEVPEGDDGGEVNRSTATEVGEVTPVIPSAATAWKPRMAPSTAMAMSDSDAVALGSPIPTMPSLSVMNTAYQPHAPSSAVSRSSSQLAGGGGGVGGGGKGLLRRVLGPASVLHTPAPAPPAAGAPATAVSTDGENAQPRAASVSAAAAATSLQQSFGAVLRVCRLIGRLVVLAERYHVPEALAHATAMPLPWRNVRYVRRLVARCLVDSGQHRQVSCSARHALTAAATAAAPGGGGGQVPHVGTRGHSHHAKPTPAPPPPPLVVSLCRRSRSMSSWRGQAAVEGRWMRICTRRCYGTCATATP